MLGSLLARKTCLIASLALLALVLPGTPSLSAAPRLRLAPKSLHWLRPHLAAAPAEAPPVVFRSGAVMARGLTRAEAARARALSRAAHRSVGTRIAGSRLSGLSAGGAAGGGGGDGDADGGGADVSAFEVYQTFFLDSACESPVCPSPCNVVLLLWTEATPNAEGVDVYLDGSLLGTLPGLAPIELPGVNGVNITSMAAGPHTFRIEESGGTFAEASIEVLDAQPFDDVTDLSCAPASADPDLDGNCILTATWTNGVDPPEGNFVAFDGNILGVLDGAATTVDITGVPPGPHAFSLAAIESPAPDVFYLGCFVETTCDIACAPLSCAPPRALTLCQLSYGPGEQNDVYLEWTNGEEPYGVGIDAFVDGTPGGRLPTDPLAGTPNQAFLGGLAPGARAIGVQGICVDPEDVSTVTTGIINLLTATPHRSPITGGIVCSHSEETMETSISWTLGDPSSDIAIFAVEAAGALGLLGFLPGDATGVTIGNAASTDEFLLQFFIDGPEGCYGSELYGCEPVVPQGNLYIPGLCNGAGDAVGNPQITAAIFGLAYLFSGGLAPPCVKACDANADGRFDLSDMVYILNYLFSGGAAPPLWVDSDENGLAEPTCIRADPQLDDCVDPHAFCAGG